MGEWRKSRWRYQKRNYVEKKEMEDKQFQQNHSHNLDKLAHVHPGTTHPDTDGKVPALFAGSLPVSPSSMLMTWRSFVRLCFMYWLCPDVQSEVLGSKRVWRKIPEWVETEESREKAIITSPFSFPRLAWSAQKNDEFCVVLLCSCTLEWFEVSMRKCSLTNNKLSLRGRELQRWGK